MTLRKLRSLRLRSFDVLNRVSVGILVLTVLLALMAIATVVSVSIAATNARKLDDVVAGRLAIHSQQIKVNGENISDLNQVIQALQKEIADLQARAPVPGPKGDKGDPGKDGRSIVGPQGPPGRTVCINPADVVIRC